MQAFIRRLLSIDLWVSVFACGVLLGLPFLLCGTMWGMKWMQTVGYVFIAPLLILLGCVIPIVLIVIGIDSVLQRRRQR
jgi:Na+(H+)/acetate symporter ActP